MLKTAEGQFKLANIWQAKGQAERALAGYEAAIALRPDYIPAHIELGNLLVKNGRFAQAIAVYQRAIAANPHDASLHSRLARLKQQPAAENDSSLDLNLPLPAKAGRGRVLLYSDCSGVNGAEQCNHLLLLALQQVGYQTISAQGRASHHLISERQQAGVHPIWLPPDDLYDDPQAPSLTDSTVPDAVFTAVQPDLILFSDGSPVSNLAAKQAAARLGIPYIVVVHCATAAWAIQFAAHLPQLPALYQQAEAVIAVSQENLDLLHQRFGLPTAVGRVIYNGRPAPFFAPTDQDKRQALRQALRIPADAVVVMTTGRMEPVKGYQYQLQAIAQLRKRPFWPNLYFVWVGTGTLESQLRAKVEALGIQSQVLCLGERPDVPDLLNAADIFVLPSQFEGMPLSVMEAMAKGLAVMATAVSGTQEELGNTGQLLPNPLVDAAATVNTLIETLATWATNANLRRAIGQAGQQRAITLFQAEHMLSTYLTIIEKIIA